MKRRLTLLCAALILSGCAQLSQLVSYSLTQQELTQRLNQRLGSWSQDLGQHIGLNTHIDDVQLTLQDNQARLKLAGAASLSGLLKMVPVSLKLDIQGRPSLEGKAVYLRDLKILNARADVLGYGGKLGPNAASLRHWLTGYLDQHPIYRLPSDSPWAQVPVNMAVQQGKLVFTPQSP